MNVRKPRTHQCGLTNVDFRTQGDLAAVDRYHPTQKYTDMGTMSKTNFKHALPAESDLKERWKTEGGWLPMKQADAITDEAVAYYNDNKKALKKSVEIGHKHDQLQPEKWTDHVFTGDNVNVTASLSLEAGKRHDLIQKRTIGASDDAEQSIPKESVCRE